MPVTLSPLAGAGQQFFDNNGNPLTGGKIYTYLAGSTTPAVTYTTVIGNIAHTNPIILDSAGRVPSGGEIWLTLGVGYKFVVTTSADVVIGTYDNIPSSAPPAVANDADSIQYEQGFTVTAGGFVIGRTYRILTLGNTNFTLIGATSNTIGLHFIATGAGTGTGTAEYTRTVEVKLRESASVDDFDPIGDGVADDTIKVQAAINSGVSELYFPKVYRVTTLTVTAPIRLYGPGGLKKTTVRSDALLRIRSSNVEIDSLQFIGASPGTIISTTNNQDNAVYANGLDDSTKLQNITIKNCKADGFAGFALRIDYAINVLIENNIIQYCGYAGCGIISVLNGIITKNKITSIQSNTGSVNWYGIIVTRDPDRPLANSPRSTNCIVSENIVLDVPKWNAYDTHAGYRVQFINNVAKNCKNGLNIQYDDSDGLYPQGAENILASGNIFEGLSTGTDVGFGIASLGLVGYKNKNITITNNQLTNFGNDVGTTGVGAIYFSHTNNAIAANNYVERSVRRHLGVRNACDNLTIIDNVFNGVKSDTLAGNNSECAYFRSSDITNSVVRNNKFLNTTGDPAFSQVIGFIYYGATQNILFSKNKITPDPSSNIFISNQFPSSFNAYEELRWEPEPVTIYDTGLTLTAGNTTQLYDVPISTAVRGELIKSTVNVVVNRNGIAAGTAKILITPTFVSTTFIRVLVYTVDGSTFGSAYNIPMVLTVSGIIWA